MDEKLAFIAACLSGDDSMTVLCARHGISRQTGYQLKRRYLAEGARGLDERSRAPHRHGRATSAAVVVQIVEARRARPHWGPKKLLAVLQRTAPEQRWPSPATVSDILRREGLSQPRKLRRRPLTVDQPFAAAVLPNDAWCIDFKGWFRTGDGARCDPFTVSDAMSRYLLAAHLLPIDGARVQAQMDELFQSYGLPLAIRSDNGPPFASTGAGGLTRLSARWAKMGLALERIQPGRPQQNGRHERMHRTLKAEACVPAAATPAQQQARLDAFRHTFNHERPHEALGQRQPADLYAPSPRRFVEPKDDPDYGDDQVRRVRSSGEIKWRGGMLFLSEALVGEAVGIQEREDGHHLVRFNHVPLGLIDRDTGKLVRFGPGRPPRPKAPKHPENLSAIYPG